jgi:hypothetical protein
MSEYLTMKLDIEDKEDIVAALEKIGIPFETHDTAVNLHGYQGDTRKQTAEIVIRRQHIGGASNDLGFKWNGETKKWEMIVSDYDNHSPLVKTFEQVVTVVMLQRACEDSMRTCEIVSGSIPTNIKSTTQQPIRLRITR